MPSVAIEPRVGGGPVVAVVPCEGTRIAMTMPEGVYIFEDDDGARGIEGGMHSLTIHEDGMLEYDSPTGEFSVRLPHGLATQLYNAFEGLAGNSFEDEIDLEGEEEQDQDPQEAAARKRRSRVKKETRRTQRKRRNTVRK